MGNKRSKLVLLIVLVIFLVIIPLLALVNIKPAKSPRIHGKRVIVINIAGELLDYPAPFSPGLIFGKRPVTVTDIVECLDRGARDKNVKAAILKIYPSTAGVAKCEEIEDAVKRFRKKGKEVYAFSPLIYGYGYLIASAADSVFMPPSGYLLLPGVASSAMFVKGTFDKLGIKPNFHRIEKYKSAPEMYTEKKRTAPSRQMTEWLLRDIYKSLVNSIAANRSTDSRTVGVWIDRAIYSPATAADYGLIDKVKHWDEIAASFKKRQITMISLSRYMEETRRSPMLSNEKVAVVHAQGVITMGKSGFDLSYGLRMGSESVIRELKRVRDDRSVKAVVLRVDSPGGDADASDMISREVEITRKVKPIVVSMSDVAASGGYEISFRANKLVAMPGTFTGSIGSFLGKFNMKGFYNKIGVTKDEIGYGKKALMFSDYRDFSPEEWKVIKEEHWKFYRQWIAEVARYRRMSVGRVDSLGRGRVWTGDQAVANGLIDEIGGLDRAVAIARDLAGIKDSTKVAVVHYPGTMSYIKELFSSDSIDDLILYNVYRILNRDNKTPAVFMRIMDDGSAGRDRLRERALNLLLGL